MKPLSERMTLYMDAGFPILYITTFEEDKADRAIREAAGNREIVEWNVRGLFFKQAKQKVDGVPLIEALGNFSSPNQTGSEKFAERYNLRRKVLVLGNRSGTAGRCQYRHHSANGTYPQGTGALHHHSLRRLSLHRGNQEDHRRLLPRARD